MFKRRDANGDGVLSADEMPDWMEKTLEPFAPDEDGSVTWQSLPSE